MSAQRLSEKSKRRIERATGFTIARAWAHGGYWMDFVVATESGHEHGRWNKTTSEVNFPIAGAGHYDTCDELDQHGRYLEPEA